jgi:ABC-2 family transporter protein
LATAIIYSVALTPIVSYLTYERVSGLKHLQVISGLNLGAYWVGNYIIDLLKMMIIVAVTIGLFKGFSLIDSSVWAYFAFPFAVLPFTYVTSLIFNSDSGA